MASLAAPDRGRAWPLARAALIAAVALVLAWTLPVEASHHPVARGEHRLIAVADLRGQALLLIDLEAPDATRRLPLPGGPHELVQLPDGRIVASLEQYGALAIVEPASAAVEVVPLGGVPHGLAVRDGLLHVTDRGLGTVRRLRLGDWAEVEPLPAGVWPHAVTHLASGALVVADAAASQLRIGDLVVPVSELSETVAVSPGGTRVATAGALGDTVEVFDGEGRLLARTWVGGRPVRVAYAPSGDRMAVALSAAGAIALIDASGAVRRVEVGGLPDGLLFDGDLLFAGDLSAGRLVAIDYRAARVLATYKAGGDDVRSTGALLALRHDGTVGGLRCPVVRQ